MKLRTERCEECGLERLAYDAIHVTVSPKQSRRVCTRCFNVLIAERAGVRFEHSDFAPIVLEDAAGTAHEFHFRTRHGADHIALDAFEIDQQPGAYEFQVLGNPSDDPIAIFQRLFERMRRELARTHIEADELGPRIARTAEGWVIRAQIEWDAEEQRGVPRLVVDGKDYSWDEIGHMLTSFEGFRVKMEVYDRSEER